MLSEVRVCHLGNLESYVFVEGVNGRVRRFLLGALDFEGFKHAIFVEAFDLPEGDFFVLFVGGLGLDWGASSSFSGGARPQTAEIIKTFNQRCSELTVTNNLGKANFVIVLDHEGGKGLLAHRNKIAVFNQDGDDIFSNSTRELGNAVKDACDVMMKAKK
jgi:hypothetical protein